MKAAVDFGLQQLRSIVLKPRLNTWIDQFTSYNHILNEVRFITKRNTSFAITCDSITGRIIDL